MCPQMQKVGGTEAAPGDHKVRNYAKTAVVDKVSTFSSGCTRELARPWLQTPMTNVW